MSPAPIILGRNLSLYRTKVNIAKSFSVFCARLQKYKKTQKTLYNFSLIKYNNNIK